MRPSVLAGALLTATAALVPVATAQEAHTWDYGAFVRVNILDPKYDAGQGGGIGGRVGYFFAKQWEAQLDLSYNQNKIDTAGSVKTLPVHLRLVYNFPADESWAFFLGAGYTYENTSGSLSGSSSGWGGVLGLRIHFTPTVAAFVDYDVDKVYKPITNATNGGLEFGVAWLPGNEKPKPAPAPAPAPPPAVVAAPAAAVVAAAPADDDHDGVPNTADKCPNTPAGEPVDSDGCSASQKDDDHDGVMNNADKCPNTPAGETVDANGCSASQRDSDGDGVTDDKDKCPDTPHGTAVDESGCPIPPLILQGVNFESNKAVLLPGSSVTLDKVASSLLAHPKVSVEIEGYTDNSGTSAYNHQLSLSRAEAVKAYLVSRGVPADRMTTKGFGEDSPLVPNTSAANKAKNRRVELKETTN